MICLGKFLSLWVIRRKLSVDPSWLIFERELLSFRVIRMTLSVHPSWLTILSDTLCMPEYLLSTLNKASIYVLPWVLANEGSFLLSVIGQNSGRILLQSIFWDIKVYYGRILQRLRRKACLNQCISRTEHNIAVSASQDIPCLK